MAVMDDAVNTTGEVRSHIMSAFSYLGILCFVPLLFGRDDEFVHFHARQGLILWMWGVLALFTVQVPVVGTVIASVSALVITICSIVGLVSVLLDKAWKIPGIYTLAAAL